MEDEEESIMDANNVTADAFSHASISKRENVDPVFTCEKLDNTDELVNTIHKLIINDAVYVLNKATASDAQGDIKSDPDTVTHTSNGILDGKSLSVRAIGEVPVQSPPENPVLLVSKKMMTPVVKKIFAYATSGNA